MNAKIIKVLIVDDSLVCRELLTFILESDPEIKVIGYAEDGESALEILKHLKPDIITMDIVMPKMNGYEATRKIMHSQPIPIVVISSLYEKGNVEKSFQAIDSGALAILEKPSGVSDPHYEEKKKFITDTIKMMSGTKLIKRHYWQHPKNKSSTSEPKSNSDLSFKSYPFDLDKKLPEKINAVVIGASLGGPQALSVILGALSASFPVPIIIVQHIAAGFTHGLVNWLKNSTPLKVLLAENGMHATRGCVYIAPDNFHLEVRKGNILVLVDDPGSSGLKPSVGRLFHSAAEAFGADCIGVILTGMGRDGAEDLLFMKQKGAYTISQDEETSVIFGMPGEAIRIGAVKSILPLTLISKALERLVKPHTKESGRFD